MNIEAKGALKPEDYVQANRLHGNPAYKWGLPLCLLVYAAINRHMLTESPLSLSFWGPIFVVGICLSISWLYYTPYVCRRSYDEQKDLQQEWLYQLDDEKFNSSSTTGNVHFEWPHFAKWKIGKDLVILYRSSRLINILPKRFFKDGDFEILIEFLKTKLPQK